jgi:hypothetical protein
MYYVCCVASKENTGLQFKLEYEFLQLLPRYFSMHRKQMLLFILLIHFSVCIDSTHTYFNSTYLAAHRAQLLFVW